MDKEEFHKTLGEKERKLYTRFSTLLEISETVFHEFGNHDYWGYNLTPQEGHFRSMLLLSQEDPNVAQKIFFDDMESLFTDFMDNFGDTAEEMVSESEQHFIRVQLLFKKAKERRNKN